MRIALTVSVLVPWLALAAPPDELETFRAAQEERARSEVGDLMRVLCPEQCVLLSVSARVDEDRAAKVEPGFTSPAEATVPALRGFNVEVAVDAALPKAFRDRVESLVKQRLKATGAPARVNVETVAFPPPRALAQPQPAPSAMQQPPPQIIKVEAPAPAPAPAPPALSPSERAALAMADAAPFLLLGVLAALTFLCTAALVVLALRKTEPKVAPVEEEEDEAPAAAPSPAPGLRALRKLAALEAIARDRAAAARVVHEALEQNEARTVAVWLRELGSPLLEVVRPDAARHTLLLQELSQPGADEQEVVDALAAFESRLTGARLASGARGPLAAFEFLSGHAPEDVAAAFRALEPEDREVAVRFAPESVRGAALPLLTGEERRALAMSLTRPRAVSPDALGAVAERTRKALNSHLGQAAAREALGELLSTFDGAEQRALHQTLRATSGGTDAPIIEDALASLPQEILERAALSVPPRVLVAYLGGADEAPRRAVLAACPRSLRRELDAELSSGAPAEPAQFRASRREVLRAVESELSRGGVRPPAAEVQAS